VCSFLRNVRRTSHRLDHGEGEGEGGDVLATLRPKGRDGSDSLNLYITDQIFFFFRDLFLCSWPMYLNSILYGGRFSRRNFYSRLAKLCMLGRTAQPSQTIKHYITLLFYSGSSTVDIKCKKKNPKRAVAKPWWLNI